jgi:CBS domain containing-hemolysin-like protein
LNSFFAAAQAAFGNVRRQNLREQAELGNRLAGLAEALVEDSVRVLTTFDLCILINRFVIAGIAVALGLPLLTALGQSLIPDLPLLSAIVGFAIVLPLFAILVYILTEMLPTTLALRNAEQWSIALLRPAQFTQTVVQPLVIVIAGVRRWLAAPLGGEVDSTLVTEEKIMTLVDAGEEEGAIEYQEKEMIYSIFQLDETLAREIMVPRIDIVALALDTPLAEARKVIIDAGHSRIPVYGESLDHIEGLLYAKDLLEVWQTGKQSADLHSLLRPALFVPESKRVSDLLRELQTAKVHLAIVIDEYGGTAGLVTIEDIVEEIVGEIIDEYDHAEEARYQIVADNEFIFDARIDLDDFNHLLGVELSDDLGDTLGGFIYARLGKVPESGEVIQTERLRIEVLSVVDRRIRKVRVRRTPPSDDIPVAKTGKNGNDHVSTENSY